MTVGVNLPDASGLYGITPQNAADFSLDPGEVFAVADDVDHYSKRGDR